MQILYLILIVIQISRLMRKDFKRQNSADSQYTNNDAKGKKPNTIMIQGNWRYPISIPKPKQSQEVTFFNRPSSQGKCIKQIGGQKGQLQKKKASLKIIQTPTNHFKQQIACNITVQKPYQWDQGYENINFDMKNIIGKKIQKIQSGPKQQQKSQKQIKKIQLYKGNIVSKMNTLEMENKGLQLRVADLENQLQKLDGRWRNQQQNLQIQNKNLKAAIKQLEDEQDKSKLQNEQLSTRNANMQRLIKQLEAQLIAAFNENNILKAQIHQMKSKPPLLTQQKNQQIKLLKQKLKRIQYQTLFANEKGKIINLASRQSSKQQIQPKINVQRRRRQAQIIKQLQHFLAERRIKIENSSDKQEEMIKFTIELLNSQFQRNTLLQAWIYTKSHQIYTEIIANLDSKENVTVKDRDTLAYSYSSLASLKINHMKQNSQAQEIETLIQKALQIYDNDQPNYFEEKISILNNLAVYYQNIGRVTDSIDCYQKVLKLQDKYFDKNEQRRAMTLNNLACLYCKVKKFQQKGFSYFDQSLSRIDKKSEIYNVIQSNYNYYKKQSRDIYSAAKINRTHSAPKKFEK